MQGIYLRSLHITFLCTSRNPHLISLVMRKSTADSVDSSLTPRHGGSAALFGSLHSQRAAQRVAGQRDFAILPRRKAKDQNPVGRAPVLLTKALLEKYFGMSLSSASKELVIVIDVFIFNFLCASSTEYPFCIFGSDLVSLPICREYARRRSRRFAGSIYTKLHFPLPSVNLTFS